MIDDCDAYEDDDIHDALTTRTWRHSKLLLMSLSAGVAHTQNAGLDQSYAPTHIVGYAMDGVRANRSEITLTFITAFAR